MEHSSSEIIAPFTFGIFRLTFSAIDTLYLPDYKGSAIRGSFGHAFRRILCVIRSADCRECALAQSCVYAYIFETIPSENDAFLRNKDKAAHPYIIRPPADTRQVYEPGEEFAFHVILIGKAIDYIPYFAYAFINMGQSGLGKGKGKFMLKQIESVEPEGKTVPIYLDSEQVLRKIIIPVTCDDLAARKPVSDSCTLRFLTRLELKEKRRYPDVGFGVLFRSLLRRITTLAHLHCGIDCTGIDFKALSHAADNIKTVSSHLYWEDASRYSNRQKQHMPFGGLKGEITFEGDFSLFWLFLLLGEWVHVGKKTSFGLGQYALSGSSFRKK